MDGGGVGWGGLDGGGVGWGGLDGGGVGWERGGWGGSGTGYVQGCAKGDDSEQWEEEEGRVENIKNCMDICFALC